MKPLDDWREQSCLFPNILGSPRIRINLCGNNCAVASDIQNQTGVWEIIRAGANFF